MKALDTNILVRYYLQDDKTQGHIAYRVIEREAELFVAKTTLLELQWVLSSNRKTPFPHRQISKVIEHLMRLPNVTIEDYYTVLMALESYRRGLDFAGALHLAAAQGCTTMLSFDGRRFVRRANRLKLKPRCEVPA